MVEVASSPSIVTPRSELLVVVAADSLRQSPVEMYVNRRVAIVGVEFHLLVVVWFSYVDYFSSAFDPPARAAANVGDRYSLADGVLV